MKQYSKAHAAILLRLMELAEDANHIDLSIGYVDAGRQCRVGIVVRHAPSGVVKAIINDNVVWCCHLENDGLHLEPHPDAV